MESLYYYRGYNRDTEYRGTDMERRDAVSRQAYIYIYILYVNKSMERRYRGDTLFSFIIYFTCDLFVGIYNLNDVVNTRVTDTY